MSNEAQIKRWQIILELLREDNKTTFQHLKTALSDFDNSDRNIRRDIKKLREEFHLEIVYNKRSKAYELQEDENLLIFEKLLHTFSLGLVMNQALQEKEHLSQYIQISQNANYAGMQHLPKIMQAILDQKILEITYQSFTAQEAQTRLIEPYLLKEFENRWYLVGRYEDSTENKTQTGIYALERIQKLRKKGSFEAETSDFDPKAFFQYTFGIYGNIDTAPQKVVLSFETGTGKYIKTRPLHHSQEILIDNEEELRISLFVTLTYDLEQRILFHHAHVKVLEPESLAKSIKEKLQKALAQYN